MAATGCASAVVTCRCTRARRRREPQVLPAYGLQDLRSKNQNLQTQSNPNTMCLQTTLGEDHGSGHFYLAKNRTFLLCVDMNIKRVSPQNENVRTVQSRNVRFSKGRGARCEHQARRPNT